MATLVSDAWLLEHGDRPDALILDPRRPVKYLQGHVKNAVNLPVSRAFDADGRLLAERAVARWLGAGGVDSGKTLVVYDGHDGRNAAMLAWLLEYMGCSRVCLLELFFEGWTAKGHPVFYRPIKPEAGTFTARLNRRVRATLKDMEKEGLAMPGLKLVDLRSRDEYVGKQDTDGNPGHIPGAINIVWSELVGDGGHVLLSKERLSALVSAAGLAPGDEIVAYCRTGMRAAVGYVAFQQLGYDVRLYDGSYAEWARSGLPVEAG